MMKNAGTVAVALALCCGSGITASMVNAQVVAVPYEQRQPGDQPTVNEHANVTIAFTIRVPENNEVIPNNISEYKPGQHELIPALEAALTGMKQGEQTRVDLKPEEAFGPYDEKKVMKIERDKLPPTVQTGAIYRTLDGRPFTVVALAGDQVVADFNHPLAGKRLVFDVTILRVTPRS